jgi:hypothetical protein
VGEARDAMESCSYRGFIEKGAVVAEDLVVNFEHCAVCRELGGGRAMRAGRFALSCVEVAGIGERSRRPHKYAPAPRQPVAIRTTPPD